MRNILNINSDWILSTEKTQDGKAVHKRILPLNKEDEYCYYLESYLDGGFVQGKAAEIQHHQLEQLLKKRLDALGRRSYTLECKLAAAQLALAEYDRAEATLDALTARWPQRETPWLLHLRMAAALRDGAAIQKTLHDIEEKEVYLSAKGRETVRFWQGKNA